MHGGRRLVGCKVERLEDDWPDLSYLGEYTDRWQEGALERPGAGPREYRYFIPANCETEEEGRENLARADAYGRDWWSIGVQARAEVAIPVGGGAAVVQEVVSGGLWGIASDSDRGYLEEVAREEVAQVRALLEGMGMADLAAAVDVEEVLIRAEL